MVLNLVQQDLENVSKIKATEDDRVAMIEPVREGVDISDEQSVYGEELLFGIQDLVFPRNGNVTQSPLLADEALGNHFADNEEEEKREIIRQ